MVVAGSTQNGIAPRKRAPKGTVAVKTEVLRLLTQQAASRAMGGIVGLLEGLIRPGSASADLRAAMLPLLDQAARSWWEAKLLFVQSTHMKSFQASLSQPTTEELSPSVEARRSAAKADLAKRADGLRDEVQRRVMAAPMKAAHGSPAAAAQQRPASIGTRPSLQKDAAHVSTVWDGAQSTIKCWIPPVRTVRVDASHIISRRRDLYRPKGAQEVKQLKRVKGWRLGRLMKGLRKDQNLFFAIGAVGRAVRRWATDGGTGTPPIAVLAGCVDSKVLPVMTAQFNCHLWSVRDMAPFDPGQCAALAGTPQLARALHSAVDSGVTSESKVRQLVGQGTADGCIRVCFQRLRAMLTTKGRTWLANPIGGHTVGCAGGGVKLSGYQALRQLGGNSRLGWSAEGCEIAQGVADHVDGEMGEKPFFFKAAEDARLANKKHRVTLEVCTLKTPP